MKHKPELTLILAIIVFAILIFIPEIKGYIHG